MANLQTLPPELHAHIAYLSCLGNMGNSIRSLSQVSRYFNTIARPFLFHTVSVNGVPNLTLLDAALHNHASPSLGLGKVNIKNLYIGVTQAPATGAEKSVLPSAVHRILVLSSGSLRTLTLDLSGVLQESAIILARMFRLSFPKLEQLALVGFYPNPTIPSRPPSPQSSLPPSPTSSLSPSLSNASTPNQRGEEGNFERKSNFPNVKRLHLSGNRNPSGLLGVGNLAKVFPELEELKVSGLSGAVGFAVEVECALRLASALGEAKPVSGGPQSTSGSVTDSTPRGSGAWSSSLDTSPFSFTPHLPPLLRLFQIQPRPAFDPSTATALSISAMLKDGHMMLKLQEIRYISDRCGAGEEERGRVLFQLLDRRSVECEEVWEGWRAGLVG